MFGKVFVVELDVTGGEDSEEKLGISLVVPGHRHDVRFFGDSREYVDCKVWLWLNQRKASLEGWSMKWDT